MNLKRVFETFTQEDFDAISVTLANGKLFLFNTKTGRSAWAPRLPFRRFDKHRLLLQKAFLLDKELDEDIKNAEAKNESQP